MDKKCEAAKAGIHYHRRPVTAAPASESILRRQALSAGHRVIELKPLGVQDTVRLSKRQTGQWAFHTAGKIRR
jgi:hypothetical protein